jgi:NIMA (never in mitosis gene a)-related kinase
MEHYEVLEPIGSGSFGSVCKIRRKADDKILVWKEINYGNMSEKEKQLLVSEVNILRELRNPFIVRYYDRIVEKQSRRLYIVMEFCTSGDLGKLIKQHKKNGTHFEEGTIWRVLAQAVIALKDCHRHSEGGKCQPILHRDIKPANILLDADMNIKIGDFGLAKELSSQSMLAQTNVGTPFYMSPELINEKKYDERSDIWSLGCLVYEMATLQPPFTASNQLSLAMKINKGRFAQIPAHYSTPLSNIIKSMLRVDLSKRPRIDEVETSRALSPYLRDAKIFEREFIKTRTLRTLERELYLRESELKRREAAVTAREGAVEQKEAEIQRKLRQIERMEARSSGQQPPAAPSKSTKASPKAIIPSAEPELSNARALSSRNAKKRLRAAVS